MKKGLVWFMLMWALMPVLAWAQSIPAFPTVLVRDLTFTTTASSIQSNSGIFGVTSVTLIPTSGTAIYCGGSDVVSAGTNGFSICTSGCNVNGSYPMGAYGSALFCVASAGSVSLKVILGKSQ